MRLIIATSNQGKLKEIRRILEGINIPIISLNELDKKFRIIENGKTFLDNAVKKALPVSSVYTDDYVVSEDSGLCVDFLNNAPGIFSKRYSGKNATDLKNNLKLLKELKDIPAKKRIAYYSCSLVLFRGGELIKSFEGELKGIIDGKMAGENG
ncbi:MAG: non-canonical purine NTP pyrophosphatase, partial [Candidatus Omnitrophica bacterium]|nr:non-canonical purine NTP pyrophosphatase [Candidatus Omnitrophota bacterium]